MGHPRHIFLAAMFALVLLGTTTQAVAQFSPLDELTAQLGKKLKKEKAKRIAVGDFRSADGSKSAQGEYFTEFVAQRLAAHERKLVITDRKSFMDFLDRESVNPGTIATSEVLKRIGTQLGVDFVLVGSVSTDETSYAVRVGAYRVKDAMMLIEKSTVMKRTGFTESLSAAFPPKTDFPVKNLEDKRIDGHVGEPPRCIYCPQPEYTDFARSEKRQGTSVFAVLLSADGRAIAMHCKKMAGYGLDENAYNAITTWKFRPATNDAGDPISVIVDIEVTFHLY